MDDTKIADANVMTGGEWRDLIQSKNVERAWQLAEQGKVEAISFNSSGMIERIAFWSNDGERPDGDAP